MTSHFMRRAFCVLLTFLNLFVGAQGLDSAWVMDHYTKREVQIPMRDGTKLFTTIYAPRDKAEMHPILMMRTPYSVAPYGKRFSPRLYQTHWANYLREGYILVMQDVRGKFMSEGQFVDVRPFNSNKKGKTDIDEASDAYDTIDWLVKNTENNNGRVGVFGISYPGFYATMAALSNHPALKAVSPQAPVTDWFIGDDFHHKGAFALMDGFSFYYHFGRNRTGVSTEAAKPFVFPEKDNYSFYLKQGALKNYSRLIRDSVPFWNDLMAHPNYDDWWKARDARRFCKNVQPAILIVGGTFDAEDCWGAWNLYKAIEAQCPATNCRLVMGPWFHGGWHRGDGAALGNVRFGTKTSLYFQNELEPAFFNEHLKGKKPGKPGPEATIFITGQNEWTSFESWPPKNAENRRFYLQANHGLMEQAPVINNSSSVYTSDPEKPVPYTDGIHLARTREYMSDDQRFAARRTDVLVFQTPVLTEDLVLTGPVIADLKVQLSSSDADFVVKLIDVFPDDFKYDSSYCCHGARSQTEMAGYQMLVRGEIMRGRYRNSFERPEAFVSHTTDSVRVELPDVAHNFKKGHRLMIQIQSSWFPLFDRNPQQFVNIYTCEDKDFVPCHVRILHEANAASSILLPVLKN